MPSLFLIAVFFAETGLGIEIRQYDTHEGPQEGPQEDTLKGQVAFPFAKDEAGEKLRKAFAEKLQNLLADGTIKALSEKNYGVDVTEVTE